MNPAGPLIIAAGLALLMAQINDAPTPPVVETVAATSETVSFPCKPAAAQGKYFTCSGDE